jgi:hypothetical protein
MLESIFELRSHLSQGLNQYGIWFVMESPLCWLSAEDLGLWPRKRASFSLPLLGWKMLIFQSYMASLGLGFIIYELGKIKVVAFSAHNSYRIKMR